MSKRNKDDEGVWGDISQHDVRSWRFSRLSEDHDKIKNEANSFAKPGVELDGIAAWKANQRVAAIPISVHKQSIDVLQIALEAAQ
jgi:2'-5' RNA ligase